MKKIHSFILTALLSPSLFAATFFSGETGGAATLSNEDSRGFDPALYLDGFFAGQLTVSDTFSGRAEFSLYTDDMYKNGITQEAEDSVFQINELSLTATKSFLGMTHTLSFFLGHFETIGSQQYITRHLGIKSYSSMLTETYLGQTGAIIYPAYGLGGCYSATFKDKPVSAAFMFAKIKKNFEDTKQLNADFRFACAYQNLKLDWLFGAGAPLYTIENEGTENEREVFLLIDTLYFHTGFDMLLGNEDAFFSLYSQYGLEYYPVRNTDNAKYPDISKIHILAEPRFNFKKCKIRLTAFNMPEKRAKKLIFLDEKDTFGANLCIFSDRQHTKKTNYSIGANLTGTFEEKHINDLEDKDLLDSFRIKLCPFADIEAGGGKLKIMPQIGFSKLAKNEPDAVKIHIGYKKEL
ncbi:hypothetical protein [uncultured Treponema sp.]|uniref:hypothetical protein n=1 Tax=uncultured Treponema sp. TaxID=162155 RepID=UPI0025FC3DC2|nr:hypothetical protein [uncultured Treponema sp.]